MAPDTVDYVPLEALNAHPNNEAEEEQPRKRSNIWHRIDTTSVLTIFLGFPLLLLAVAVLALFWHESMKAINGGEPNVYWLRIVNAGWAAQLVTVCTASIRAVVAFQAGLATAMVAAIALETAGTPLLQGPLYSMLRAVKVAPSNFWTATNFQPHLSRFIYALVLTEVLVTGASQFLSTIFLADFGDGTFSQRSIRPIWTFAELEESFDDRSGFHDTGHTFRAFLPFEEEAERTKLRRLHGPVPVMDHRVVCSSPPLSNLSLDSIVQNYMRLSGQIPTEELAYPLLLDSYPHPYINFTCRLPSPVEKKTKTQGETSLCVPKISTNWTVLNEDPLIQPYGFPESSALFLVLDIISDAAMLDTLSHIRTLQTIRTEDPWAIISNGSPNVEAFRISACLTNFAVKTVTVGMNSTFDNLEPKTTWDHHVGSYNTAPSRLQLGVSSLDNKISNNHRGILTLDPRSKWEDFHIPPNTPGAPGKALGAEPNFFSSISVSFPNSVGSSFNFDPSVILSRKIIVTSFGNAHMTHVDLFQDTLITTNSPALALQAVLTRIYQMAYYQQLIKLDRPVVATTAFSLTATIPVRWTFFVLGMALIVIHSVIMMVVVVMFVISTEISFIGSYWQTVAQVVSKETQPILEVADQMDDDDVRKWAKREKVESLRSRLALRGSDGRVTLGLVEND